VLNELSIAISASRIVIAVVIVVVANNVIVVVVIILMAIAFGTTNFIDLVSFFLNFIWCIILSDLVVRRTNVFVLSCFISALVYVVGLRGLIFMIAVMFFIILNVSGNVIVLFNCGGNIDLARFFMRASFFLDSCGESSSSISPSDVLSPLY
jgi:hypothetical protein